MSCKKGIVGGPKTLVGLLTLTATLAAGLIEVCLFDLIIITSLYNAVQACAEEGRAEIPRTPSGRR